MHVIDLKCILLACYTFGRRKQKIPPSFPLKTIRRYLKLNYINKLNYNFQLVLLFCFKMHACMRLFLRNGPAVHYGEIMER
jgi:hypothetical protein